MPRAAHVALSILLRRKRQTPKGRLYARNSKAVRRSTDQIRLGFLYADTDGKGLSGLLAAMYTVIFE